MGLKAEPEDPPPPQKIDIISWVQKVDSGEHCDDLNALVFVRQWEIF